MSKKAQRTIGYGSAPDRDRCRFVWHVECHEPMRQKRKPYMLSMDSAFHEGYDFQGATCAHCQKPMF